MVVTRLIIVRHGETDWNVEGRYQGQLDSALTSIGRGQAEALAERFSREEFSALYSSDLGRARETAERIAVRTGHRVQLDSRLRERGLGQMQGLIRPEFEAKMPEEYQRFRTGDWDWAPPEGESGRQSVERFQAGLTDLAQKHAGNRIAIVTHGGVLGGFLRIVLGVDPDHPRRFRRFNASWNVFSLDAGRWFVDTWGDISHLEQTRSLDDT